jgi:hypothetical protein
MFIMMNEARLAVGMQGVAIADRATQRAVAYAKERKQGRGSKGAAGEMSPIIEHADVRRNLMTMKALTQAARCICLATARELDAAHKAKDTATRSSAYARAALLTPVAKAFSTDIGVEVASIGVQVHGGMGFIEETGAAQHYRDARILPIYEGTNGIQALDLVTRKLPLEGGRVAAAYIEDLKRTVEEVRASNRPDFGHMGERLSAAVEALAEASRWLGSALVSNPEGAMAGGQPYLRLFGLTAGGVYLARGALTAARVAGTPTERIALARYFAENLATAAPGLKDSITCGAEATLMLEPDALSA